MATLRRDRRDYFACVGEMWRKAWQRYAQTFICQMALGRWTYLLGFPFQSLFWHRRTVRLVSGAHPLKATFNYDSAIISDVNEPTGNIQCHGLIQQRQDESHFGRTGGVYVDCQWQSVPVDQDHELAAFAELGRTNAIAPFFTAANVPLAVPSFQFTMAQFIKPADELLPRLVPHAA